MQCRSCHAEIADKALICYKCGTATTEAKYQPAAVRSSSRSGLIATVVALALLVAAALYIERVSSADTSRWVSYGAVAVAVIIVGIRAYARRR